MGWADALKAVAGGLGGAARGFSGAAPMVIERQQRDRQFETERADVNAYRQDQADLDRQRLALQGREVDIAEQNAATDQMDRRWSRYYTAQEGKLARFNSETARMNADTNRILANMETRAGTSPQGGRDITSLPVGAQNAIVAGQTTSQAMERYAGLVRDYMGRGRISRGLGAAGVPNAGRDFDVGQIEGAMNNVLVNMKELANLGVLNGPDMELLTSMIGDPTAPMSIARDPAYTLAKLEEAGQFISNRVDTYRRTYGVNAAEPGAPSNRLRGINLGALQGAGHGAPPHPDNPYRQAGG